MGACYRTRRCLGAHVYEALDTAAANSTAAHVAVCSRCQRAAGELQRLRGLLRASVTPAEPDWTGFWQGVVRGIEDRRPVPPVPPARRWWQVSAYAYWALGGVLAAVLLLSLAAWPSMPGPRPSEAGVLVTSASTDDPRGTVMVYATPEQDVAVVWVFGLE
jgi:hypothetical protein